MKITKELIDAAFGEISDDDAVGTGTDADGILDGSDDWDHPSAAAAREITKRLGMAWNFTTWEDAEERARAAAEDKRRAGRRIPQGGARGYPAQDCKRILLCL